MMLTEKSQKSDELVFKLKKEFITFAKHFKKHQRVQTQRDYDRWGYHP